MHQRHLIFSTWLVIVIILFILVTQAGHHLIGLEKNKMKFNKIYTPIALVVIIFLGWLIYKVITNTDERIPTLTLPKETVEYMGQEEQACPFLKAWTNEYYNEEQYKIYSLGCNYDNPDKDGEDPIIEIYTKDFEQGKYKVRDWLAKNGLSENDKLRITYIHKPNGPE